MIIKENRLKKLIKLGLKGLEIDNGGMGKKREESLGKIINFAKKYNLILSSGSDFHGDDSVMSNSHILGNHNCSEEVINKLRNLSRR